MEVQDAPPFHTGAVSLDDGEYRMRAISHYTDPSKPRMGEQSIESDTRSFRVGHFMPAAAGPPLPGLQQRSSRGNGEQDRGRGAGPSSLRKPASTRGAPVAPPPARRQPEATRR